MLLLVNIYLLDNCIKGTFLFSLKGKTRDRRRPNNRGRVIHPLFLKICCLPKKPAQWKRKWRRDTHRKEDKKREEGRDSEHQRLKFQILSENSRSQGLRLWYFIWCTTLKNIRNFLKLIWTNYGQYLDSLSLWIKVSLIVNETDSKLTLHWVNPNMPGTLMSTVIR